MEYDTRVGAYGVIVKDDSILLAHITAGHDPEAGWTLPGGGLEFGEDPQAAAIREVREETGLIVELDGSTDDVRWFDVEKVAGIRRVELVNAAVELWRHATIANGGRSGSGSLLAG